MSVRITFDTDSISDRNAGRCSTGLSDIDAVNNVRTRPTSNISIESPSRNGSVGGVSISVQGARRCLTKSIDAHESIYRRRSHLPRVSTVASSCNNDNPADYSEHGCRRDGSVRDENVTPRRGANVFRRSVRLFDSVSRTIANRNSSVSSGINNIDSGYRGSINDSSVVVRHGISANRTPERISGNPRMGSVADRYGTPVKSRLRDDFCGYKFLIVSANVDVAQVGLWLDSASGLTEEYVTIVTRYGIQDVVSCVPSSCLFRYAEDSCHEVRIQKKYILSYVAFNEPHGVEHLYSELKERYDTGFIFVAEVISSSKLLKCLSKLGPIVRTTVSGTRLDRLQQDFLDERLLTSFEKFLHDYDTPVEKRNLALAYRKRLESQFASVIIPVVKEHHYTAQKWLLLALDYALRTPWPRHRNIALIGEPGSGKSFIIEAIRDANAKVELVSIIVDVLQPHLLDLVLDYHKVVVFENIHEHHVQKIPGTAVGLLEHRLQYSVKRRNNRTDVLNTMNTINIAVYDTDIVSTLVNCSLLQQCGIIIEFSEPRIRTSETEIRPLPADDTVWCKFTASRVRVPYKLLPGNMTDLF